MNKKIERDIKKLIELISEHEDASELMEFLKDIARDEIELEEEKKKENKKNRANKKQIKIIEKHIYHHHDPFYIYPVPAEPTITDDSTAAINYTKQWHRVTY